MITMDRKAFFATIRAVPFGGILTETAVKGLNALLDTWDDDWHEAVPVTQFAYVLGTAYHETWATMQPIKERGSEAYFRRLYDPTGDRPKVAAVLGNTVPGDGATYCGRGYVQLTGRALYARAGGKLGLDLLTYPNLALDPRIAARILFAGMEEGWFTGMTLDRAIDPLIDGDEHQDFVQARRVVNGQDRAEAIACHADNFLAALQKAA